MVYFVGTVKDNSGTYLIIIHARKCWETYGKAGCACIIFRAIFYVEKVDTIFRLESDNYAWCNVV